MSSQEKDIKPAESISLKVLFNGDNNSGSDPLLIKLKKSTKISKIVDAVAQKLSVAPESVKLLADGVLLDKKKTVGEQELEDGDSIDAVLEQTGGSGNIRKKSNSMKNKLVLWV
jgi:small ubiquitin-related modifier